jgi:hypothetical protein
MQRDTGVSMKAERAPTTVTAREKIAAARWVLLDSRKALDFVRQNGLPPDATVFTFSPALLADQLTNIRALDANATAADFQAIFERTQALGADLHQRFSAQSFCLTVSRVPVQQQAFWYRAACLGRLPLDEPGLVAEIDIGEASLDKRFKNAAARLLVDHPSVSSVMIPFEDRPASFKGRPKAPPLLTRLRYASALAVWYRLIKMLSVCRLFPAFRGTFLILRENELLRETAAHLALKGFALADDGAIPKRSADAAPLDRAVSEELSALFGRHLAPLLPAPVRAAALQTFLNACREAIADFITAEQCWRQVLAARRRVVGVLGNALFMPAADALFQVCRERRIPFILFQHGVTREICDHVSRLVLLFESTCSDFDVVFNPQCGRLQAESTFRRSTSLVSGMPHDYFRSRKSRKAGSVPPIWYISTALYQGNLGLLNQWAPDWLRAETEKLIVDEVLSQLPHRIFYKPYPATRYLDGDPVVEHARTVPNIHVYNDGLDLRYIAGDARILVTSRATSTVSWCLMNDKPVIFIDFPDQAPLRNEARLLFEKATLFFDAREVNWRERLRAYLSQPIDVIERDWAPRDDARRQLLHEYFDAAQGRGGGKDAARQILTATREYGRKRRAAA